MAGDGGGYAPAYLVEIKSLFLTRKLVQQLVQHLLNFARLDSSGSNFDGNAAGAEGLRIKPVLLQFVREFSKNRLLCGREFNDYGHKQTLAFYLLLRALMQDSFK